MVTPRSKNLRARRTAATWFACAALGFSMTVSEAGAQERDRDYGRRPAARAEAEAPAEAVEPRSTFDFAPTLSASGYYASTVDKKIADDFVPYDVNSALWTDGALKDRFVRVPAGTAIQFDAESAWDFPVGTTFLQTLYFEDDGVRVYVETRVLVRGEDDIHFASYAWDDEAEDAELVGEEGDDLYALHGDTSQLWSIAARTDCRDCHNEHVEGRTLGITVEQLNRPWAFGSEGEPAQNQLHALQARGVLAGVPAELTALPRVTDPSDKAADLEPRVRSYLATNCSGCHRPGGPGSGTLDLRLETSLADSGLLRRRVVVPEHPRGSRLLGRMATVDWARMPPVLSTVPDEAALAMIQAWIQQKPDQPRTGALSPRADGAASAALEVAGVGAGARGADLPAAAAVALQSAAATHGESAAVAAPGACDGAGGPLPAAESCATECGTEASASVPAEAGGCCAETTAATTAATPAKSGGCCSEATAATPAKSGGCCSEATTATPAKSSGCCSEAPAATPAKSGGCCSEATTATPAKSGGCCSEATTATPANSSGCCSDTSAQPAASTAPVTEPVERAKIPASTGRTAPPARPKTR